MEFPQLGLRCKGGIKPAVVLLLVALTAVPQSGITAATDQQQQEQQQTSASSSLTFRPSVSTRATVNSTEDVTAGVWNDIHHTQRSLQAARQLQGVPNNALQFTGVRFESSMRAKASMVASRQTYASYLQRRQRSQSVQATWSTLRKQDKASLMASLGSDSALAEAALPDTWDSRSVGIVTPPKDQGDCGTCVAHAVTAAAETAILMSRRGTWNNYNGATFDISEQQLYFCLDDKRSCSSGWDIRPALRQLVQLSKQKKPLYTSKCLAYNPDDFERVCTPSCQEAAPKGIFDWTVHDSLQSAQRAIIRFGGVITYMWLTEELLSFLTDPSKATGVFKGRQEVGTPHAVFVIGYSNPGQYWIVKNSFGTNTGDGGYLKVGYGEAGIMEPDSIYGLNFVARNCFTYTTSQGDTLEWLCGRLGLSMAAVVIDNRDVLSGINKLEPGTQIKLCNIPPGRFQIPIQAYSLHKQVTREGYVYGRVDALAATFYIFPMPGITYNAAKNLCSRQGGELATYDDSRQEFAAADGISNMFNVYSEKGFNADYDVRLWLGYYKPKNSPNWVNTKNVPQSKWPYRRWNSDQPAGGSKAGAERCSAMEIQARKGGTKFDNWGWFAAGCNLVDVEYDMDGAVCRLPPVVAALGPAPKAWDKASLPEYKELKTKQGLPCFEFKLTAPSADKGTFKLIKAKFMEQTEAQQLCKAEGGNLASIHSEQALDALRHVVDDFGWPSEAGKAGVWIGLYSDGPGQPLKWYDGSPLDFTKLTVDFPQKTERVLGALFVVGGNSGAAYFYHSKFLIETALCKVP